MRIALLQMDIAWEDPEVNYARASAQLEEAADGGAELAILPEMFATGFSMVSHRVAEYPDGPTLEFLRTRASTLGMAILAGIAEHPGPRNNVVLVEPDGAVSRQTKLHPFSGAQEQRHYVAGQAVRTFGYNALRFSPLICYDLRFPEPFRIAARDTDLFVVVANWPAARRDHWVSLLKARAIENLAYVAGINRVGEGDGIVYAGDSVVFGPWGELVGAAGSDEEVLLADIAPARVAQIRASFPVLMDRRPEVYHR